jgi:hypothetical protein
MLKDKKFMPSVFFELSFSQLESGFFNTGLQEYSLSEVQNKKEYIEVLYARAKDNFLDFFDYVFKEKFKLEDDLLFSDFFANLKNMKKFFEVFEDSFNSKNFYFLRNLIYFIPLDVYESFHFFFYDFFSSNISLFGDEIFRSYENELNFSFIVA